MNSLDSLSISFVWTALGQVSISLLLGIIASFAWTRNAARAHRLLSLSVCAAMIMPALSFVVLQLGWGQIVPSEQRTLQGTSRGSTTKPGMMNDRNASVAIVPAGAMEDASQPEPGAPRQSVETLQTSKASANWISAILLVSWATLSALLLCRFLTSLVEGWRVLSRAKPLNDPAISKAKSSAVSALGLRVDPRLLVSKDVRSPVIWCWGRRPVLLLPKLLGTTAAWIGVLCHELAHWKRHDHLWALMSQALTTLLPWHPLCWWARRRLAVLT